MRTLMSEVVYLCWLAHFLPNHLPLVVLVILDRLQQGRTLSKRQSKGSSTPIHRCEANKRADLVFRKLRIVHILASKSLASSYGVLVKGRRKGADALCTNASSRFLLSVSETFWLSHSNCYQHPAAP